MKPIRIKKIVYFNDAFYRREFNGLLLRCLSHEKAQQGLQKVNALLIGHGNSGLLGWFCYLPFHMAWKQERSTGMEAKRQGQESMIDLKNHC